MHKAAAERNRITLHEVKPEDWKELSENTHLVVFGERRRKELDRIDFALVAYDENKVPLGYLTARELDEESVYWQFGGAFPGTHSSAKAVEVYIMMVDWTLKKYQRITTLVENSNVRYLRLAMHAGFRIIGCRTFKGQILVELLNEGRI